MRKKFTAAILAITLMLMGSVFLFAKDIEVTVSEIEAQEIIDKYLATNQPESLGVRVSPNNILIDFKANNTAQVQSDMLIDGYGYTGQFDGTFSTIIKYNAPRLYLDNLQLKEGGFQTDETTRSDLQNLKQSVIKMDRSSERFVEDTIIKTTKLVFESIPIYDLRNSDKTGIAVSLALKEVNFTEDSAIIKFSPVTALLRGLAAIGMIFLAIGWCVGPSIVGLVINRTVNQKN